MYDGIRYWMWLGSMARISPRKRYELICHFKQPEYVWYASEQELADLPFMDKHSLDVLIDNQYRNDFKKYIDKAFSTDVNVVTINDSNYPEKLRYIYDPPLVLYTLGKLLVDEPQIAVVGSRRASSYGMNMSEKISFSLSKAGLTITSGMARGIDSKAHLGALDAGGRTIAVLGCGVDITYPYENRDLMKRIIKNGAVISEFMPGTPPLPINFPSRNRIISGMSMGTLIVEAGEKSGSLITANYALEQGREVFAMPGNIDSKNSFGTNRLIRDGAKVVLELEDILDELKISYKANNSFYKKRKVDVSDMDNDEAKVLKKLGDEPMHIDKIAGVCEMSIGTVYSVLIMLELKGFVKQLPGKMYNILR
jgi:DNA protecting protein DprA